MLLYCGLLLICLNCVRTTEYAYDYGLDNSATEWNQRFSYWPSFHNALARLQKRDLESVGGQSEGGSVQNSPPAVNPPSVHPTPINSTTSGDTPTKTVIQSTPAPSQQSSLSNEILSNPKTELSGSPKGMDNGTPDYTFLFKNRLQCNRTRYVQCVAGCAVNETVTNAQVTENQNETTHKTNITATEHVSPTQLDITRPGVMMRGVIVFGGFLLLAVAYLIFYRGKSTKNDPGNNHNSNDAVHFRYGVLQSEDRSNLELSRVPLTMESDEDEDEDLEIFDLEQKKKSLSYVNLQTNDEDLVFDNDDTKGKEDKETLLLDIEDPANDTLINWSNNGSKSIL